MKTAYSYTVLRYVHDISTGEFVNAGVALYAPDRKYASALCRTTYGRLSKTFPGLDGDAFRSQMRFIQSRLEEIGQSLLELELEPHPKSIMEFVHRVLPTDDSSLQWSAPGSGLTEDPSATLESLFNRLVMAYDEKAERATRSDGDVWRTYKREIESRHLMKYFEQKTFSVEDDEVVFEHAWKNGKWHCIKPLSFDLAAGDSIRDKAHEHSGRPLSTEGVSSAGRAEQQETPQGLRTRAEHIGEKSNGIRVGE